MNSSRRLSAFFGASLVLGLAACGSSSESPDAGGLPADGGAVFPDAPAPGIDGGGGAGPGNKLTFESGPVRPLALSPDGTRLFVANTANGSLDILDVTATGLAFDSSIPVGVDPVAVAARSDGEVWVVNQVSDSVSVVDVAHSPARVVNTLLVGDEPSDIVFASGRAFITTAHRGQRRTSPALASVPGAGDPQLTTPGVGRADVWVFDVANVGSAAGGVPLAIVTLFGDTPRALAVTPDGKTVYAAIFKSGNQTTATSSQIMCAGFDSDTPCTVSGTVVPGSQLGPPTNHAGVAAPRVGVILKTDPAGVWRDARNRDWTAATRFDLPDEDVFAIDAATLAPTATYRHVGTTLFAMAVNPRTGVVYVSNTESRNDLRFEGPGTFAGTTLQGHLAESRITVLAGDAVNPRHLNKHIDYGQIPAPAGTAEHSLSTPLDLAVSSDGATLYVAAFGSSKIGVFTTASIEDDSFDPTTASAGYIAVSGGGPGGLALDEAHGKLYVSTRFDDGVSVVDLATSAEIAHLKLATPESAAVANGRRFLYDATVSSANGEASCASCHMFGDADHLAWDLGNPDGDVTETPINIKLSFGATSGINGSGDVRGLHPMKGPMTTQTLRGTVNHGPMHWRGDRVSGLYGTDMSLMPPYDAELAFKNFVVAFNGLLGRADQLADADMQSFSDFALAIVMPPNPIRALDNSLTDAQARGKLYFVGCDGMDSISGMPVDCTGGTPAPGRGHFADGVGVQNLGFTCEGCHTLNPELGFFGTDGESSFEALPQTTKIPQLRNLYDKVGMFGVPPVPNETGGSNAQMGDQVRGTGFEHDGSVDTLFRFLEGNVFRSVQQGKIGFFNGDPQRRDVEQYLFAFDSDLAPIVGQQVTLTSTNAAAAGPRVDLLVARAGTRFVSRVLGPSATECDLAAHVVVGGTPLGYLFRPADGTFTSVSGPALSDASLRALAATPGQEITYTCLPPGWGDRVVPQPR